MVQGKNGWLHVAGCVILALAIDVMTVHAQDEACCFSNGSCQDLDPFDCDDLGGYPLGPGTTCLGDGDMNGVDEACEVLGACCVSDGTCFDLDFPGCITKQSGIWRGPGTMCAGDNNGNGTDDECEPTRACCQPNGTCSNIPPLECVFKFDGLPQGPGTDCSGDLNGNGFDDMCEDEQACCLPDGSCVNVDVPACLTLGGAPGGEGHFCSKPQACCLFDGTCSNLDPACCTAQGGFPYGPGTLCADEVQACCFVGGDCLNADLACCELFGGAPGGPGSVCLFIDNDMSGIDDGCEGVGVTEACCLPDGSCAALTPMDCTAAGGTPQGPGSMCTANEGCCLPNGICHDLDPLCCVAAGGATEGPGTTCTAAQACCLPDGTCADLDPLCCEDLSGISAGIGTSCAGAQACCLPDETCVIRDGACCALVGGLPQGMGSFCSGPTLECPADALVECDQPVDPGATGSPVVGDDCDNSLTPDHVDNQSPGGCPQAYTITRTWTVTDADGNTASCVQTITVDDSRPPSITCPDDALVPCGSPTDPAAAGSATALDNCDPAPMIGYQDDVTPGVCPQESIITRTWAAVDACGNAAFCVQTITVDDSTPPNITCPADVVLTCTGPGGINSNTVVLDATASDNCDQNVSIVDDRPAQYPATCGGPGTTVTFTATDDCGNSAQCSTEVKVAGAACCNPQACCLPNGTCVNLLASQCLAQGGTPQGIGSACTAPRACCLSGVCQTLDPLCCVQAGGLPLAPGAACQGDPDGDGVDGVCGDACPQNPDLLAPEACCPNQTPSCLNQDCDDVDCDNLIIPTVSEWGLVILTLLLLVAARLAFGDRRRTA